MNIKDKILSCLIYGSIGDAYGAFFEGTDNKTEFKIEDINSPYITDDTQLTLATCEAIIENNKIDPEKFASKFVEWFKGKKITGIGASTLKSLQELSVGHHWALTGRKGERAAGNGAAMRIAPISFLIDINDEFNKILIKDICRITHHNDEAYLGALCLTYIHQLLLNDDGKKIEILKYLIEKLPDSSIRDRFISISNDDNKTIYEIGKKYGSTGYVVDTVPLAIYSLTKSDEMNFKNVLDEIISLGGDTDTISSISLQMYGLKNGLNDEVMKYFRRIKGYESIYKTFIKFADYCQINMQPSTADKAQ